MKSCKFPLIFFKIAFTVYFAAFMRVVTSEIQGSMVRLSSEYSLFALETIKSNYQVSPDKEPNDEKG
jgi:hypothetical protein